jgi:catechol-2,3-dioxygenase
MHIRDIMLYTADFEKQRTFYSGTLGFPVVEQNKTMFKIQAGWTNLTFRQSRDNRRHIHHIAFNIPPHQLDAALAWTEARVPLLLHEGKKVVDYSSSIWQARSCYFEDAAGNVLEWIGRERTPAPNLPADFTPATVYGVGEMGLALDDPAAFTATLRDTLDLPVFDGDPSGTFCALGDDHGLLLVVETGRNWLPTDNRPSGEHPVTVTVVGQAPGFVALGPYTVREVAPVRS